jgi:hypothetical protein
MQVGQGRRTAPGRMIKLWGYLENQFSQTAKYKPRFQ